MGKENERIFAGLDAEWTLVCADPDHAAAVGGWLREAGVFTSGEVPSTLEGLLAALRDRDLAHGRDHSDVWLGALLREAAGEGADAQLAARVVVQAMLPGAFRMARRLMRSGRNFDEVGQTVVACLYQVVRTYPLSRRGKVAANLLLETLHWASRELKAECEPDSVEFLLPEVASNLISDDSGETPEEAAWRGVLAQQAAAKDLVGAAAEELSGARGELVELLVWAVAAGAVEAGRARVIARETREGAREEAERAGISPVAWRQRRSRTVRQLRVVAAEWVQAA
ncbi:hypothetical protein [Streptomyces odonnellii]|uniref:hypothetical protein n=1 Tax=Streptomyces odonnellii TaxID=1417980 RepID=UPI000695D21C|nr:hypothetical protein [Streptomyces odonnellii]